MDRGADLTYLSCFPAEAEYLYPPLTYLQPVSLQSLTLAGSKIRVVEVEPRM